MSTSDSLEIELTCPQCGKEIKKPLARLKKNTTFPCPGCNTTIRIGNDEFTGAAKGIDDFLKGLK